jgi:arsenate reductase
MRIHTYAKCDSCRKAVKWLKVRGLPFEEIPIRERPPSPEELRRMLAIQKGELKRLFNTSGGDYRELKLGERLATLSEEEAIHLLAANGNLVKRPFLLTEQGGLVGFREAEWETFFGLA